MIVLCGGSRSGRVSDIVFNKLRDNMHRNPLCYYCIFLFLLQIRICPRNNEKIQSKYERELISFYFVYCVAVVVVFLFVCCFNLSIVVLMVQVH